MKRLALLMVTFFCLFALPARAQITCPFEIPLEFFYPNPTCVAPEPTATEKKQESSDEDQKNNEEVEKTARMYAKIGDLVGKQKPGNENPLKPSKDSGIKFILSDGTWDKDNPYPIDNSDPKKAIADMNKYFFAGASLTDQKTTTSQAIMKWLSPIGEANATSVQEDSRQVRVNRKAALMYEAVRLIDLSERIRAQIPKDQALLEKSSGKLSGGNASTENMLNTAGGNSAQVGATDEYFNNNPSVDSMAFTKGVVDRGDSGGFSAAAQNGKMADYVKANETDPVKQGNIMKDYNNLGSQGPDFASGIDKIAKSDAAKDFSGMLGDTMGLMSALGIQQAGQQKTIRSIIQNIAALKTAQKTYQAYMNMLKSSQNALMAKQKLQKLPLDPLEIPTDNMSTPTSQNNLYNQMGG